MALQFEVERNEFGASRHDAQVGMLAVSIVVGYQKRGGDPTSPRGSDEQQVKVHVSCGEIRNTYLPLDLQPGFVMVDSIERPEAFASEAEFAAKLACERFVKDLTSATALAKGETPPGLISLSVKPMVMSRLDVWFEARAETSAGVVHAKYLPDELMPGTTAAEVYDDTSSVLVQRLCHKAVDKFITALKEAAAGR